MQSVHCSNQTWARKCCSRTQIVGTSRILWRCIEVGEIDCFIIVLVRRVRRAESGRAKSHSNVVLNIVENEIVSSVTRIEIPCDARHILDTRLGDLTIDRHFPQFTAVITNIGNCIRINIISLVTSCRIVCVSIVLKHKTSSRLLIIHNSVRFVHVGSDPSINTRSFSRWIFNYLI